MYKSLISTDGATAVGNFVGSSEVTGSADGLIFAPPEAGAGEVKMPERLMDWLIDLRLLRHIPITYLVPDSALLPTESIRFFHVDPTWVDRVIDGVFSAVNTGTTDAVFSYGLLAAARKGLDKQLQSMAAAKAPGVAWTVATGMTGMLIRSELARRWPDMIVEAWTEIVENWDQPHTSKQMAIMRAENISRDIYIALFAGKPKMVTIREPFSGVRFGVEPQVPDSQTLYKVDSRLTNGVAEMDAQNKPKPLNIVWRGSPTKRVINFVDLGGKGTDPGSTRQLAVNLEQKPYMQEFKDDAAHLESLGSQDFTGDRMTFRKGRYMTFKNLQIRLDQQKAGV